MNTWVNQAQRKGGCNNNNKLKLFSRGKWFVFLCGGVDLQENSYARPVPSHLGPNHKGRASCRIFVWVSVGAGYFTLRLIPSVEDRVLHSFILRKERKKEKKQPSQGFRAPWLIHCLFWEKSKFTRKIDKIAYYMLKKIKTSKHMYEMATNMTNEKHSGVKVSCHIVFFLRLDGF